MLPNGLPGRACLILLFAINVSVKARTQNSPVACSEVHVYASVINDKKQVVGGLGAQDFSVELNGAPVQVKNVEHNLLRHRVVILIDHSGSMRDQWAYVYAATQGIVQQLFPLR